MKILNKRDNRKTAHQTGSELLIDIDLENRTSLSQWADQGGWIFYPHDEGGESLFMWRRPGGGWWILQLVDNKFTEPVAGPFPCRKHVWAAWKVMR